MPTTGLARIRSSPPGLRLIGFCGFSWFVTKTSQAKQELLQPANSQRCPTLVNDESNVAMEHEEVCINVNTNLPADFVIHMITQLQTRKFYMIKYVRLTRKIRK